MNRSQVQLISLHVFIASIFWPVCKLNLWNSWAYRDFLSLNRRRDYRRIRNTYVLAAATICLTHTLDRVRLKSRRRKTNRSSGQRLDHLNLDVSKRAIHSRWFSKNSLRTSFARSCISFCAFCGSRLDLSPFWESSILLNLYRVVNFVFLSWSLLNFFVNFITWIRYGRSAETYCRPSLRP